MRILWLKTELLHPVDKGGKIRSYHVLAGLSKKNHVTYLSLDDGSAAPDALESAVEYCSEVVTVPFHAARRGSPRFFSELAGNLFSHLPYAVARWRSRAFERKLQELAEGADLMVCDFLVPSVNVPRGLPCPKILFQHNVEAMIWKRHAEVARSVVTRRYMREQWRRMARFEANECRRYDRVLAVSETDREIMEEEYGLRDVAVVPTGVDTHFFQPDPAVERDPRRIVFTGSMDWMPNQDGILWFLDEVLPAIEEAVPEVQIDVVGRRPTRALLERAEATENLRVTGFVDDIRPWIQGAGVAVVPLRVGGGTRLKIYEAMALETPVVSTTIGWEGLPLEDGAEILTADDAQGFAEAAVRLMKDPEAGRALGLRAAHRVRAEFGWNRVAETFEALCREAIS